MGHDKLKCDDIYLPPELVPISGGVVWVMVGGVVWVMVGGVVWVMVGGVVVGGVVGCVVGESSVITAVELHRMRLSFCIVPPFIGWINSAGELALLKFESGPDNGRLGSVNTTLNRPPVRGKFSGPCFDVRSPIAQERGASTEHRLSLLGN